MHKLLAQLEAELTTVLGGLDARQTQLTPAQFPEKWNVQQIIEHLLLSMHSTTAVVQTRLDKGSATRAVPTMQQKFGQFTVIALGWYPSGRKAPAAVAPTRPSSLRSGEELRRKVHEELASLDSAAHSAEAPFGNVRCASHMIMGPLSIAQWRKFHLIHGEHHIKQIRRIRQDHQV